MTRPWCRICFTPQCVWPTLLLLMTLGSGCTTTELPPVDPQPTVEDLTPLPPSTQIALDQAVYFQTPEGEPVVVAAGTYEVHAAGDHTLQLTGTAGGTLVRIAATPSPQTYLLDQREPVAVALAGTDEDSHHILFAQVDGTAFEATGSYSGTRTRGADRFVPYSLAQHSLRGKMSRARADVEDTGFVSIPGAPPMPVGWSYLRMHAPDQIVSMVKRVQTGGMSAGALEGLASSGRIQSLLAKPYPDVPAVLSRGVGFVRPPSSNSPYRVQPYPSSPSQVPVPPPGVMAGPLSQASPIVTQPHPSSPVQPPAITSPLPEGMTGPPSEASKTLMRSDWSSLIAETFDPAKIGHAVAPVKADVAPATVDFGNVWDGQVPRAEIRIVVPKDGGLTISLGGNRPFRIVKAFTATGFMKLIRTTPTRATLVEQEPTTTLMQPPWNLGARAGQDLWVVIEFAPRADFFAGDSAGQYHTAVNVDGYQWTASIPVTGYFHGAKIGVIPMLENHDLHLINPFHPNPDQCAVQIPQRLTLLNAGQSPQAVVVEPLGFPGQFSMPPVSVTVPAGGMQQIVLPITLHCLSDPWEHTFDLAIRIKYPGQERQTGFTLTVYPSMYRVERDGTLGSCKYSTSFWAHPDGDFHLTVTASTSALLPRGFEYAYYFRGSKVAALELYLEGTLQLGTGVQKGYGFRQPGLEANYMQLFAERADVRMRCVSK